MLARRGDEEGARRGAHLLLSWRDDGVQCSLCCCSSSATALLRVFSRGEVLQLAAVVKMVMN